MTECPLLRTLWLESDLFRTWAVTAFGRDPFWAMQNTQLHVHHIFGGKTRKDLPSNTITICGAVHDFCHAHQTEGRIACLWWKLNAGELEWTEIDQSAGYSVAGWLDAAEASSPFRTWLTNLRGFARGHHAMVPSTDTSPPMPHT